MSDSGKRLTNTFSGCSLRYEFFTGVLAATVVFYIAFFGLPNVDRAMFLSLQTDAVAVKCSTDDPNNDDIKYYLESRLKNNAIFKYRNESAKPWQRSDRCGDVDTFKRGRRILINYASNCCSRSQLRNCQSGLDLGGFDVCIMFNETSLDDNFKKRNERILKVPTGAGLWAWKPYVIFAVLNVIDDDDWLVYADSGSEFIANFDDGPNCLLAKQRGDLALFTTDHMERQYTKADAFLLMNCLEERCYNGTHLTAAFSVFRRHPLTLRFVAQWLTYAQDYRIIGNEPSKLAPEAAGVFKAHRNDQSICSVLAKKFNIEHWPDPSQFGSLSQKSRELRNLTQYRDFLNKDFIYHSRDKL